MGSCGWCVCTHHVIPLDVTLLPSCLVINMLVNIDVQHIHCECETSTRDSHHHHARTEHACAQSSGSVKAC